LTNDHNCRARAQSAGIPTLELKNLTRPLEVLTPCVGSLLKLSEDHSTTSSRWAPSGSSSSDLSRPPRMQYRSQVRRAPVPAAPYHNAPDFMNVEDIDLSPPRSTDSLTRLHDEFVETMTAGFRAYIKLQEKQDETSSKLTVRKGGSWDSVHAPKSPTAYLSTKRPLPVEVETWTCGECIDHIMADTGASTGTRAGAKTGKPDVVLAKQLVSPAGSGGRKGREWTLGGWKVGLEQLKDLAVYCGIEGLEAQVGVWRARVWTAFERV